MNNLASKVQRINGSFSASENANRVDSRSRLDFTILIGNQQSSFSGDLGLSEEDISEIISSNSCCDIDEINRINEIELHQSFGPNI